MGYRPTRAAAGFLRDVASLGARTDEIRAHREADASRLREALCQAWEERRVNDAEARIVIDIYRRYLALKSVHALRDELADAGIKSKRRMRPDVCLVLRRHSSRRQQRDQQRVRY